MQPAVPARPRETSSDGGEGRHRGQPSRQPQWGKRVAWRSAHPARLRPRQTKLPVLTRDGRVGLSALGVCCNGGVVERVRGAATETITTRARAFGWHRAAGLLLGALFIASACGGESFSGAAGVHGGAAGDAASASAGEPTSAEGGGGARSEASPTAGEAPEGAAGQTSSAGGAGSPGTLECDELGGEVFTNRCYVDVTTESVTYDGAVAACDELEARAGRAAYVLVLDSKEEQAFILEHLLSEFTDVSDAWLGLTCDAIEYPDFKSCYCTDCEDVALAEKRAVWRWVDDSQSDFGWIGRNPDGAGRCAAFAYNSTNFTWGWVDRDCGSNSHQLTGYPVHDYRVICELE